MPILSRKPLSPHNQEIPTSIYKLVNDGWRVDKKLSNAIRLTVHEKQDRADIPAIYLLNIDSKNKLSQHVCSSFFDNKLRFMTKFEILCSNKSFKRIYVNSKSLYWLNLGCQPLLYVPSDSKNYMNEIVKDKFFSK